MKVHKIQKAGTATKMGYTKKYPLKMLKEGINYTANTKAGRDGQS